MLVVKSSLLLILQMIFQLQKNINITQHPYPAPRRQTVVRPILEKATVDSTKNFLTKLTSFPHRRSSQTGSQNSVLMIKREIESIISKLPNERKNRMKVELIVIQRFIANSIIVTFDGSGSYKDNHALVGAHADDVGHPQAGADDDGSGSTCVYESFRIIAESDHDPSKTLVWLFYSAEESGLVGSNQIATDWKRRNMKVYAHLNYDMVGNHPANQPLAGRRLTRNTTPRITEYMFTLSKEYTKLDINTWDFNGGSDHIPWFRNGYPSACLSERVFSPHYHSSTDKIQNVNFDLIVEFSRLAASYLIELS